MVGGLAARGVSLGAVVSGMTVYRIGTATVYQTDGHTRTVLGDGREVWAAHAAQPGQEATADQYGLTAEAMNRHHDLAHTILAAVLGLRASPTLAAVARGDRWSEWWREEQAVLALQGYAAAAGVDLEQVAARLSRPPE